jgi:hypothetical protein
MGASVFFSPAKAFQSAFSDSNIESALFVVLVSGLLLGLAVFLLLGNVFSSVFVFVMNFVQWFIFSCLLWFFEFVHVRKRKRLVGTSFYQSLSAVGVLWRINLVYAFCFAVVSLISVYFNPDILFLAGVLFLFASLLLLIFWIVASFKLLEVAFGAGGKKIIVNWIVLNLINSLTVAFVSIVLAKVFFA